MTKIAIVTDSTADIPLTLQQELNILVIPLNVVFGETTYKDGVDITSKVFFEMLPGSSVHPSTSQPSPGEFVDFYEQILKKYDSIISVHISSGLSGTHQSAQMAMDLLPDADITLVDSRTASLGCGLAAIAGAEARNAGMDKAGILSVVQSVCEEQVLLLTVETLEWLQRNGRIGKASALLGSLLNVHPILKVEKGLVAPHTKVRGNMSKVLAAIVEAGQDFVPAGSAVRLGVVHGNAPEEARVLADMLGKVYNVKSVVYNEIGPVIGVHVGPGALGAIIALSK
ncbi:MAG TPA: DegV family protein [Bacillota bacterium]|nr:DegV family protein [Bacillota bacterium]